MARGQRAVYTSCTPTAHARAARDQGGISESAQRTSASLLRETRGNNKKVEYEMGNESQWHPVFPLKAAEPESDVNRG